MRVVVQDSSPFQAAPRSNLFATHTHTLPTAMRLPVDLIDLAE